MKVLITIGHMRIRFRHGNKNVCRSDVEEYLNNNPKKPYILCEFMHDMGNSMGGLGSYMKLIDKYDMYQGGFIWDFTDQAIL